MTILDQFERIQTLAGGVSGIKHAPKQMPSSLPATMLPLAMAYPEQGQHRAGSRNTTVPVREWALRVYVKPIAQGSSIDEGFKEVMPILDALRTEFVKVAYQRAGSDWNDLDLVSDDGVDILTLHDAVGDDLPRYWGTRLHLVISNFEEET